MSLTREAGSPKIFPKLLAGLDTPACTPPLEAGLPKKGPDKQDGKKERKKERSRKQKARMNSSKSKQKSENRIAHHKSEETYSKRLHKYSFIYTLLDKLASALNHAIVAHWSEVRIIVGAAANWKKLTKQTCLAYMNMHTDNNSSKLHNHMKKERERKKKKKNKERGELAVSCDLRRVKKEILNHLCRSRMLSGNPDLKYMKTDCNYSKDSLQKRLGHHSNANCPLKFDRLL